MYNIIAITAGICLTFGILGGITLLFYTIICMINNNYDKHYKFIEISIIVLVINVFILFLCMLYLTK